MLHIRKSDYDLNPKPGSVNVQFNEKLLPHLFEPYDHKALFGGRGSTKSHSIAGAIVMIAAKKPTRVVGARQFQTSIKDSVKELFELKIRTFGLSDQYLIYDREIIHKEYESRFSFIGLDRNPASIKSLEDVDICWVEEANTVKQRSMEMLLPTIRKPGSEIWWSWNPELRTDPVDAYFRGEIIPPNSFICELNYEDNPWFYHGRMPKEMEHMKVGNFKRYEHIWLGKYDEDFEGRIFPNVQIARIEVPSHIPPRFGLDFGFGSDPSAMTRCYVNHETKEIYIAREAGGHIKLSELPAMMDSLIDDIPAWHY